MNGLFIFLKELVQPLNIIARHLTIDMYNCKPNHLPDSEDFQSELPSLIQSAGFHILTTETHAINEEHLAMGMLLHEGHFTVHIYTGLKYVAADLFLCEKDAAPELLFKSLRDLFKPEKTKTTYLKRGDFGTVKDMKPRIKTKVAPLRRIYNTGARVIRLLAHQHHSVE